MNDIWMILTDEEIKKVKNLARRICNNNESKIKNRETPLYGDRPAIAYEYHGFIAEFAFAKFSNSYWDDSIGVRKGGCDGAMPDGTRFDVKSTQHQGKVHLIARKDNPDTDIFVLAVVNEKLDVIRVKGYALRKDIICDKYKKIDKKGKISYWMPMDHLRNFRYSGSTILGLEK